MAPRLQEPRLVRLPTAAEYADCSVITLRRRISSGELTGYRFGKKIIRVDLNELDGLLRPIPSATPGGGDGGQVA